MPIVDRTVLTDTARPYLAKSIANVLHGGDSAKLETHESHNRPKLKPECRSVLEPWRCIYERCRPGTRIVLYDLFPRNQPGSRSLFADLMSLDWLRCGIEFYLKSQELVAEMEHEKLTHDRTITLIDGVGEIIFLSR